MTKLDEYFDRARRETPPLHKDEVSNILREKLSERPDRETAHTRGNGVWSRSIGRIFLTLPLKGWIMISALLTSTILAMAFFWQATPQSSYNGASAPQTLRPTPQAAAPKSVSQKKLALKPHTEPKYAVKTQVSKPEALTTINTQTLKDSLPAPYDFVPVDEVPQVDMKELMTHIVYPQEAEKLGLEGKVTVRALLMPDRSVSPRSFVEYSDGMKFDSAALKAVFAAQWTPAKRDGMAVPCWVSVPVHFRLPERLGKKVVTNAQMLALTSDELKKIGVEQDAKGVVTMLGWNKSRENLYRLRTSIHSDITPKLMDDSVFAEYMHTLRKQGKYPSAANWEIAQFEAGRRGLQDLVMDSIINSNKSGIASIVSRKQPAKVVNYAELRAAARQFSLPRLVTDGHNYRYFVDMSDLPFLVQMREVQQKAKEFYQRAQAMKMDTALVLDSLNKIIPRVHSQTYDAMKTATDSVERAKLSKKFYEELRQNGERLKQEEMQFEQEKSDISKLIGIRIPCTKALAEGDEYLLWYDPTPEFIALLPERYRTGLEREVAAAKKYATKCEIPTEEERKAIRGYFDSWRSCDGVLKIASIFPNPADVKATVRFTLAEARSITITVHNLNGDRLAILEPTPMLPAGEHELPLDFTGRNVGVYLLALSTDKNETAIKRVIISR
ncbi:MAG: TonB family protein [Ignavibacteria bacterium]|nr:TonB family protein [Ignavibacteria bacterium]